MRNRWLDEAACLDLDVNLFFPEPGKLAHIQVARAKSICKSCTVREQCLDYALSFSDRSIPGIWGGTTESERRRLKRTQ